MSLAEVAVNIDQLIRENHLLKRHTALLLMAEVGVDYTLYELQRDFPGEDIKAWAELAPIGAERIYHE